MSVDKFLVNGDGQDASVEESDEEDDIASEDSEEGEEEEGGGGGGGYSLLPQVPSDEESEHQLSDQTPKLEKQTISQDHSNPAAPQNIRAIQHTSSNQIEICECMFQLLLLIINVLISCDNKFYCNYYNYS